MNGKQKNFKKDGSIQQFIQMQIDTISWHFAFDKVEYGEVGYTNDMLYIQQQKYHFKFLAFHLKNMYTWDARQNWC